MKKKWKNLVRFLNASHLYSEYTLRDYLKICVISIMQLPNSICGIVFYFLSLARVKLFRVIYILTYTSQLWEKKTSTFSLANIWLVLALLKYCRQLGSNRSSAPTQRFVYLAAFTCTYSIIRAWDWLKFMDDLRLNTTICAIWISSDSKIQYTLFFLQNTDITL